MLCLKCKHNHTCRKQLLCAINELSNKLKKNCCISTTKLYAYDMNHLFQYLNYLQKTYERVQREKIKPFIVNELKQSLPKEIIINILYLTTEWNKKSNK